MPRRPGDLAVGERVSNAEFLGDSFVGEFTARFLAAFRSALGDSAFLCVFGDVGDTAASAAFRGNPSSQRASATGVFGVLGDLGDLGALTRLVPLPKKPALYILH